MEKRIELEKRGRKANQITELNLDNCRSTSIVGLTDEFTALEILSLINVGLTTLKGFPKLPNLKELELSDNRISNGLSNLASSPKLINLNLSGNKIKDLEEIKPLESFKCLESLDLFNNEATSVENYRTKIFSMIPSLKYLDGFDAHSVEAPSEPDDEDGSDEDVSGNESSGDDEAISGEDDDLDSVDDEEEDESAGDPNEVSLGELYNDELEEDNSDWNEAEESVADEESDMSDDSEGNEKSVNQADDSGAPPAAADDESPRGKKRKHDG